MSVALCMIVRNEASGIVDALASAVSVVDRFCLIDTGSTDGTQDKVRAFFEKVRTPYSLFEEPWRDDFAWARNRVQALAGPVDWIVWLDGDEMLEKPGDLQTLMRGTNVDAILARCDAHHRDGPVETAWQARAYRPDRCSWKYPVHEQLTGIRRMVTSTAIIRADYADGVTDRTEALERFFRENPDDPHAPFFLARAALTAGDWGTAKRWCTWLHDHAPTSVLHASFWVYSAIATFMTDGAAEARKVADEAVRHHPGFPDVWHLRANLDLAEWWRTSDSRTPYEAISTTWRRGVDSAAALEAGDILDLLFRFGDE